MGTAERGRASASFRSVILAGFDHANLMSVESRLLQQRLQDFSAHWRYANEIKRHKNASR
jgi:hypothetical protein